MKRVGLACAAVVALAAALFYWPRNLDGPPSSRSSPPGAAAQTNAFREFRGALSWRDIETPDYRQYVDNLRRAGCPESTLEDIIVADINALFLEKSQPILEQMNEAIIRFHRSPRQMKTRKMLIDEGKSRLEPLNAERLELISKIIGHPVEKFKTAAIPWTYRLEEMAADPFPHLSPEKAARMAKLGKEFAERLKAVPSNRPLTGEEKRAMADSTQWYEAQVAKTLNPEEFENYLLHSSGEAARLSNDLERIEINDEEYRTLFRATRAFYEKHEYLITTNSSTRTAQAAEDEKTLLKQIETTLGPERYEQYVKATDPIYQDLNSYSTQAGLSPEQVAGLYRLAKQTDGDIRLARNLPLSESERQERVSAIMNSAGGQLDQILGEDAKSRFLKSRASRWLTRPPQNVSSRFQKTGGGGTALRLNAE